MKKTILSLLAAVACMSINAQVIKVYENGTLQKTYTNTTDKKYKVVFEEEPADPNLLTGEFTVAEGKTVKFTKSNLYWDGSAFKFEANQTDYQTSWNANHVSLFSWTSLTDYQSGTASYMPYAQSYAYSSRTTSDKFFCGEDNKITVEGTSGLFALSKDEWEYLIGTRPNHENLYKFCVTVDGKTNCLIIAPDGYTGSIESSYNATAWATAEAAGLVCLPAAGYRYGSFFNNGGDYGFYWSSTPSSSGPSNAYYLYFGAGGFVYTQNDSRYMSSSSLRLVK